jgi:antiviral helicase SKI2
LHIGVFNSAVGKRFWTARRMIVFKKEGIRTVGVLVEDGLKTGPGAPYLKVLQLSDIDAKRHAPDMLPYLPEFRHLFSPLPTTADRLKHSVTQVPLDDVECLTETVVRIKGAHWYIKIPREQKAFAEGPFLQQYTPWTNPCYNEQDWGKVHGLAVREIISRRALLASQISSSHCLTCPNFLKHYTMQHDEWLIKTQISSLRNLMSDQNLSLLPDYNQRVEVLKELGFIDTDLRVQLKGKVACEVHSADELVLTELILENVLSEYEP